MDERGYPLRIGAVRDAARILLRERAGPSATIGEKWPYRYIARHPTLRSRYTRKYNYERALCEDPEVIRAWFRLVRNTINKYGIQDDDIWNFDETGFAMGIASTSRVVTSSDRRGRPPQLQPGDREWVTAIETINAKGWSIPPMIIFKGKVHLSAWYETSIPCTWTIGVSENGWTNDAHGLYWLKEVFEPNTASKTVGAYRLLILDGHGSHATPEFDKVCKENKIITLCMHPHSSHLLQPLDVGYFAVLKRTYGTQIADLIRLGINHVDKVEFLNAFHIARNQALTERTIQSAFTATGLVPFDPERVLSTLHRPITPPQQQPLVQEQWQPETPHNLTQLEQQVALIKGLIQRRSKSPPTPTEQALNQLIKGCQVAMQGAVLMAKENERLQAANTRLTQKKQRKKRIISKASALSVAQAQALIMPSQVPLNVQTDQANLEPLVEQNQPKEDQSKQITCFICRGFDHYASECTKYNLDN
jgi:hypothetical protein